MSVGALQVTASARSPGVMEVMKGFKGATMSYCVFQLADHGPEPLLFTARN